MVIREESPDEGSPSVVVPNVLGTSQAEAEAIMTSVGLQTRVELEPGYIAGSLGFVVGVSPRIGSRIAPGDEVTLALA